MSRQTIVAEFLGGGKMAYWTDRDTVETGDKIVIETNKSKFVVATVCQTEGIKKSIAKKADRWIVQRLEIEKYLKRKITRG